MEITEIIGLFEPFLVGGFIVFLVCYLILLAMCKPKHKKTVDKQHKKK